MAQYIQLQRDHQFEERQRQLEQVHLLQFTFFHAAPSNEAKHEEESLNQYVNAEKLAAEEFPEELVPEEYLCGINRFIMDDPVTLPLTQTNCDRSAIERHARTCVNSRKPIFNPFNRQPMSLEEVIPNDQLRKDIKEYVALVLAEIKEKPPLDRLILKKSMSMQP